MRQAGDAPRGPKSIASTDRARRGPFAALVAAAADDPGVTRGLALAYEALEPIERRQLVRAVTADAGAARVCSATALVALLSVEVDDAIARLIHESLRSVDASALRQRDQAQVAVAGDSDRGRAVLSAPLHGDFVEILELEWTESRVDTSRWEPLAHRRDAEGRRERLAALTATPIDTVARVLWNHRQLGGAMPSGIERFADLF